MACATSRAAPPELWAAWRVVELLVVAMPASTSRRALRGTWRLAEVLLVAAPASASRRYPEWHAALVEVLQYWLRRLLWSCDVALSTRQRGHSVMHHRDVHR
jgi:hypothetical protein